MSQTLIIDNVDFERLEADRMTLNGLIMKTKKPSKKQINALMNVLAMLDAWSDKIYYETHNSEGDEL